MSRLAERVRSAVDGARVVDLHTHLFAPEFGDLNLWGIDELLTYHYLVAETLRAEPEISPEVFFSLTKRQQADLVWQALFVRRTPLSEATSGVVTVLSAYGLDSRATNLREIRGFFASREPGEHVEEVLRISGVRSLAMTNDPLDPSERSRWDAGAVPDPRFLTALRIDPILNTWPVAAERLKAEGYEVDGLGSERSVAEVRRFLDVWIGRIRPRYLAVSVPDSFAYPEESLRVTLLRQAVLPACRAADVPFAMMIGVRRSVNARLASAGDGMGVADLSNLERLASDFSDNRFLVTTLAKENAHGLCVVARKFANVLPFGCWWFMNNPSLVEDTTTMRLEMLGPTFVPQHSDARILDQLVYKWHHARRAIAAALIARYEALEAAGRQVDDAEIARDAAALMGGIAAEWLGLGK